MERRWKHGLEDNFSCLRLPKTATKNSAVICANFFAVLELELLYFKQHKFGNKLKPNVTQVAGVHDMWSKISGS